MAEAGMAYTIWTAAASLGSIDLNTALGISGAT